MGHSTADNAPLANSTAKSSHRLLVQLQSPSLSEWSKTNADVRQANGKLNLQSAAAKNYINQLKAEQSAFLTAMQQALPEAKLGTFRNELGQEESLAYQVVLNGLAIDPGMDKTAAAKVLAGLPHVQGVYLDYAHTEDLYASRKVINAAAAWNNAAIGGFSNAGAGVIVASLDGGIHHDAAMFSGDGYSYPAGWPAGGLGLSANNNGKIIGSRVYFRTWDPPSAGDENPWPGELSTSHGVHTSSTMAGNEVVADYRGYTTTISGVAPRAWVMSYRVGYNSITNNASFYDAEIIAALEDIVVDGADVLNNSWGGGPSSLGGAYNLQDTALVNASNAGIFVTMSNGNAGPDLGTSDHPSDAYISVGATTTDSTLAAGNLSVSAPQPVDPDLLDMKYGTAGFGPALPIGAVLTYPIKLAPASNIIGCGAFDAGTFTGMAALISRGTCDFSSKVYNAQQAGASFVIIYNHAAGGDEIFSMSSGDFASDVTIPSVFVGYTDGTGLGDWYTTHGAAAEVTFNTKAYQAGNVPDVVADFSSRGPGVGNVLKPDIVAPGVNILAQGYKDGVTGEARHLGYGQVSGTSMAAPHVSGSAALLRQIHPDWSNEYIKSALMTTSKYNGIWIHTGTHAQPLDMGAGRLDLTHAADPGVILQPVNASFGQVVTGTVHTRNLWITNISSASETYALSAIAIHGTYPVTPTVSALPGVTVTPASLTLAANQTAQITVTFDTAGGIIGDNQGWVVMDGPTHDAHFPVWGRTINVADKTVALIDKDDDYLDYQPYYVAALQKLGLSYDVYETVPDAAILAAYKYVIVYTGDTYESTGFTNAEENLLVEYANQGGVVIAMGQDLAAISGAPDDNATFFYDSVLGGDYLQDSVTNKRLPNLPVVGLPTAPKALQQASINLSGAPAVELSGTNEVPTVTTDASGVGIFTYVDEVNALFYTLSIDNPATSEPITLTHIAIYSGTVTQNGPEQIKLFASSAGYVMDPDTTASLSGWEELTAEQETALKAGALYVNLLTTSEPAGLIRAQIPSNISGYGAGNQVYIDEINPDYLAAHELDPGMVDGYTPLLKYPGPFNKMEGTVAMAHRDQPSLERPGISYLGRSVYTTFGLEGVNNSDNRSNLLRTFLAWAADKPQVTINQVTPDNAADLAMFQASLTSNIEGTTGTQYRWDFGDGTDYTMFYKADTVGHTYQYCGMYTVRVEAVDSWGNHTIGESTVKVTQCTSPRLFFPITLR